MKNSTNMVRIERSIMVRFQAAGFHSYPDAPDEVAYLRNMHRHMFHFEVEMPVSHDNRELEFHMVKNYLEQQLGTTIKLAERSCESLAAQVCDICFKHYEVDWAEVKVWEDQECGARVRVQRVI